MSRREDLELLKRLGVNPGPDLLYTAALALARRCEHLEQRVAELEVQTPGRLGDRARTMLARAMGRA